MGVNSLWTIIGPAARPVRLEALSRKKLAIDASIWIYQFLKAVRDDEGNSISQSHIVGFFRRICKLLYYGILPIFVFDGGAPALKRRVLRERQERRQQGEKEEMSHKAQKLLARQLQRIAESETSSEINKDNNPDRREKKKTNNLFRRKDEYHLPDIESFKVSTKDDRIMQDEDLNEIYEDFDHVDGIDINSVDLESKEFSELPTSTQYMILSHLRIRSRLRMGYDKDQLDALFPNRMEFSKFQIQQVQKRNFYTQRLMDVSGMGDSDSTDRRIAGDKDRRYALVKNNDGWTLSLGDNESSLSKPILLDDDDATSEGNNFSKQKNIDNMSSTNLNEVHQVTGEKFTNTNQNNRPKKEDEEDEDDIEWEDVPMEEEETEEEKQIQKAIIESIYSKYHHKDDLKKQNQLKIEDNIKKSTLQSIKNKDEHTESPSVIPELAKLDFGSSFLFDKKTYKSNDSKPQNNNKMNEHNSSMKSNIIDKIDSNDVNDSIPKFAEANNKSPKIQNTLPTWFNDSVSLQQNPFKETDNITAQTNKDKYVEYEDAGLVPWNEVQSYIVSDEDNNEFDFSKDIQEIGWREFEINNKTSNEEDDKSDNVNITQISEKYIGPALDEEVSTRQKRKPAFIDYNFEKEEENELVKQLANEEIDHEEFKSEMKSNLQNSQIFSSTKVTEDQLLQEKLIKAKRDSDKVTENMILDIQELLKRFGIPYITAPMEAEAQCAELLKLKLVDGIVTDDSDCFLFGGDKIYKNMFQQKQFVECYMKDEIEDKLGLNQESLIELALLLGSDYTEGINGIGPVLAMEILAEFGDLKSFKHWFDENTKTTKALEKNDITSLKKNLLTKVKKGKLFLKDSFPDNVIYNAYKFPEVDHDDSEFKWGFPNLDQIRTFLMSYVNWDQQKVDEIMIPLIRDMNKKKSEGTQPRIGEFFPQSYISNKKELALGKRLKTASNKLNKRKRT